MLRQTGREIGVKELVGAIGETVGEEDCGRIECLGQDFALVDS